MMGSTQLPVWDPCPSGLPVMLTGAHMGVSRFKVPGPKKYIDGIRFQSLKRAGKATV